MTDTGVHPQAGAIARYNTNGSLDTNFGISGQAACVASAAAIAIQSNGKIVVAGAITSKLITLLLSDGVTVANNQTGFGVSIPRQWDARPMVWAIRQGTGVGLEGAVV